MELWSPISQLRFSIVKQCVRSLPSLWVSCLNPFLLFFIYRPHVYTLLPLCPALNPVIIGTYSPTKCHDWLSESPKSNTRAFLQVHDPLGHHAPWGVGDTSGEGARHYRMYDARTRKSPLKSVCYEQDWCSEEPLAEHRTCCLLYQSSTGGDDAWSWEELVWKRFHIEQDLFKYPTQSDNPDPCRGVANATEPESGADTRQAVAQQQRYSTFSNATS